MKKELLDRATAIHTVKVAVKTLSDEVVQSSLNQIGTFRRKIKEASPEQFNEILNEINNWAATSPIVTEGDILELRPKLR
ncbi:hypothetical protein [Aquimarina latercula]|uniref:hypothetical protein n=1 Tax=Aquimarina latercula TaxID=987 RepID=UPI000419A6B2|nr:hypothetical protein [Aquimarina latercula]